MPRRVGSCTFEDWSGRLADAVLQKLLPFEEDHLKRVDDFAVGRTPT